MPPRPKKRKLLYHNKGDLQRSVTTSFVDEVFTDLDMFVKSLVDTNYKESFTNRFDTMVQRVTNATDLEMIVEGCNDFEICYTEDAKQSGIKCKPCTIAGESGGFFSFTQSEGDNHGDESQSAPFDLKRFRDLRSSIKKHMLSHTHGINAMVPSAAERTVASKAYVLEKVEALKETLQEHLATKPLPDSIPVTKEIVPVTKSKSIEGILKECSEFKLHFGSQNEETLGLFDGIFCSSCYKPTGKSKKGFFAFSSLWGQNFEGENQPSQFRTQKDTLARHLECKTHLTSIGKVFLPKDSKRAELDFQVGIILGKLAYKCIVRYQSKQSYEEEVAFLCDIGVYVGDINHSSSFVDKLFPELYFVLQEQKMSVLNEPVAPFLDPSPYVVFADKITPYGTTQQIIGVIMFKDGKNIPYLLDVLPVNHKVQNGAALAKDVVDTLYKFFTPAAAKKYYVGSSFDGQYLTLGAPKNILMLLGYAIDSDASNELLAETTFQTFSWDPAHLLELACGDVMKLKGYDWVEKVEQSIVTINKGHTYGKQYHRLLEIAAEMGINLMRPGSFSETRLCSYKFQVLRRFLNNYAVFFVKLSEDEDCDLNSINNCQFCLQLAGLSDIFKLIGSTSANVQSSELFPWMCDTYIEDCIDSLDSISVSLRKESYDMTNEHLEYFNRGLKEIQEEGSFNGRGIYFQQLASNMTRSKVLSDSQINSFETVINRVILEIAKYASALSASIKRRYSRNHSQKAFVVSREAFSLDKIRSRPKDYVPEEFVDYCLLAKGSSFIDPAILQESLNVQYTTFVQEVYSLYDKYYYVNGSIVPENQLYWEVMNCDRVSQACPNVLNLLLSAIVRNKSECCAESIGSMVKIHLDKRVCLTDKHLGQEIFLHFNGPKSNRDADGLVRKALNMLFEKTQWHFVRRSHPSDLKTYESSKVIDKIHGQHGRVSVPDSVV